MSEATRLVLSVPQSATIMIQKTTSAPTSANADEEVQREDPVVEAPPGRGRY